MSNDTCTEKSCHHSSHAVGAPDEVDELRGEVLGLKAQLAKAVEEERAAFIIPAPWKKCPDCARSRGEEKGAEKTCGACGGPVEVTFGSFGFCPRCSGGGR